MNTAAEKLIIPLVPELKLIQRGAMHELIEQYISGQSNRESISILEAGCGTRWPFALEVEHALTGVDMDQHALDIRKAKDLDAGILGDLRDIELPAASFDVIYSAFVLEHVDGVEKVLQNFATWLKPGGLAILTFPDRHSVYGFFTRVTPFWFHVLYKKYVAGNKNAGKPGHDPFPTFHDNVIGRRLFRAFAKELRLTVVEEFGFSSNVPKVVSGFMHAVRMITFGRLSSRHTSLMYVLKKQPA